MGVMRVLFQMKPDACLPGCIFFMTVKAEQCVEVLPSRIDRTWRLGTLRCGNGGRIPQWQELCREGTLETSCWYSWGFLFVSLVGCQKLRSIFKGWDSTCSGKMHSLGKKTKLLGFYKLSRYWITYNTWRRKKWEFWPVRQNRTHWRPQVFRRQPIKVIYLGKCHPTSQ